MYPPTFSSNKPFSVSVEIMRIITTCSVFIFFAQTSVFINKIIHSNKTNLFEKSSSKISCYVQLKIAGCR